MLIIALNGETIDQKLLPPDMCAEKFPLVSMGGSAGVKHAQTRERGPPSAPLKISDPYDNPFCEKNNPGRRERERERKNAINSGHLVP